MNERDAALPHSSHERAPVWPRVLIATYAPFAIAMLVLAARPSLLVEGESQSNAQLMRALFAVACVINALIFVAGLRRRPWGRTLALVIHSCATSAALFGLASLAVGHPQSGSNVGELIAKGLVHAIAAVLWLSAPVRRHFDARPNSTPQP